MSEEAKPGEDFAARVSRLESRSRRQQGLAVLLVLAAILQAVWHFVPGSGVISAHRFVLKERGRPTRGEFSLWADGTPAFRLNDSLGQARALFALRKDGTLSLRMNDHEFTTRAEMVVQSDGTPRFVVYGADGSSRANMWVDEKGQGQIQTVDRH